MTWVAIEKMPSWKRKHSHRHGGQAIVEFALLLPLIVLLGLGVADFGRVFYYGIVVTNAARAGAQYGIRDHYNDPDGMTAAAVADANLKAFQATGNSSTTNVPEASCFLRCPGSTGELAGGCTIANYNSCGVEKPYVYVRVRTQYTFKTIVDYPGIPHEITLQAKSVMKAR